MLRSGARGTMCTGGFKSSQKQCRSPIEAIILDNEEGRALWRNSSSLDDDDDDIDGTHATQRSAGSRDGRSGLFVGWKE